MVPSTHACMFKSRSRMHVVTHGSREPILVDFGLKFSWAGRLFWHGSESEGEGSPQVNLVYIYIYVFIYTSGSFVAFLSGASSQLKREGGWQIR